MNILVLTSIYPGCGMSQKQTGVVHYFVKEWINMGYNVTVIHCNSFFPKFYYLIPKFIKDYAEKRFGFSFPIQQLNKDCRYTFDGVSVYRISLKKMIPTYSFSNKQLDIGIKKIDSILQSINFKPNYIISHWTNPQLFFSYHLKQKYGAKSVVTIHETLKNIKILPNYYNLIKSVDLWGYRQIKQIKEFEIEFKYKPKWFRCYSGVDNIFLHNIPQRKWDIICNFIFVGNLIPRKHPDKLLYAISREYVDRNVTINIIGDGVMQNDLRIIARNNNILDNTFFHGFLKREQIIRYLDRSDIFIMISKDEAFGLVYLEAMARGCIVIASKNEGMDGIIVDGENGFLCEAGNVDELRMIISNINSLKPSERALISNNGIKTANSLSSYNVAKQYLSNITEF